MTDEKKLADAKAVFQTLCAALENRNWTYEKDEDNLIVNFTVNGEDIPMRFVLVADIARQLIRLHSPLPFKMKEEKRMDGAIAACVASYGMADGSFDYNIFDGSILFRMTASFRESMIGEGLLQYMISCSCAMVDKYNDKFLALNMGYISITDFIESKKG